MIRRFYERHPFVQGNEACTLGYAVMAEIPLVIVDVMRGRPVNGTARPCGNHPAALSAVCIALGLGLGKIRIGRFSLGSSGVLFTGLFIGWVVVRLAPEAERSAPAVSRIIGKDFFYIALCLFITSVALSASRYLSKVIKVYGLRLPAIGILVPFAGVLVALMLSRVIPGIPPRAVPGVFTGVLCGAMTSTPGLGAAVEATNCDDMATGYGAVYPVALFSMVLFTIILHRAFLESSQAMALL